MGLESDTVDSKSNILPALKGIDEYVAVLFKCPALSYSYNPLDLTWLDSAYNGLKYILSKNQRKEGPKPNSPVDTQYLITGHGQTKTNAQGGLTGLFSSPLNKKGRDQAKDDTNYYQRVFCSDTIRTIEYALRKYCHKNKDVMNKLDAIIKPLFDNPTLINDSLYGAAVKLALDNGIIPTPLLRAQSFGDLELFVEKKEKRNSRSLHAFRNAKNRMKRLTQERIEKYSNISPERQKVLGSHHDPETGKSIFESYLYFISRSNEFFHLLRKCEIKHCEIVGHSGFFYIVEAMFRSKDRDFHLVKTSTPAGRGQKLTVKLDKDGKWLNDKKCIEDILAETETRIEDFKRKSHDKTIKSGSGIITPELCVLERDSTGKDERKPFEISNIIDGTNLSNAKKYIIRGSCGYGKTTLCLYLASQLKKESSKNIPILVRLRDLSTTLMHKNISEVTPEVKSDLISKYYNLTKQQLEVFRKEGYKFYFIFDGFDEVHENHKRWIFNNLFNSISCDDTVIVTSRDTKYDEQTNTTSFKTLFIEEDAIVENLNLYLKSRLKNEDVYNFEQFLMSQNDDIKKNWLMVSLLTNMYSSSPQELDLTKQVCTGEVIHKGIEWIIWEHGVSRNPLLFTAPLTDPFTDEKETAGYKADVLSKEKERKRQYIEELYPKIRNIGTFMTINDMPVISLETVMMIVKDRWSLQTELAYRKGEHDRFVDDDEYKMGLRASNYYVWKKNGNPAKDN